MHDSILNILKRMLSYDADGEHKKTKSTCPQYGWHSQCKEMKQVDDSILNTLKHMLGYDADDCFDTEITVHINSVLAVLNQLGVGPENGFVITGAEETWHDFLYSSPITEFVKTYMYIRVRLLFDPPQNGSVLSALKEQLPELEWRITAAQNTADGEHKKTKSVCPKYGWNS